MLAAANGHPFAANVAFALAVLCAFVAAVAYYFAPQHRGPRLLAAAALALVALGLLVS